MILHRNVADICLSEWFHAQRCWYGIFTGPIVRSEGSRDAQRRNGSMLVGYSSFVLLSMLLNSSIVPLNHLQQAEIAELQYLANLNMGQCYLSLKDGQRAVKFCDKALEKRESSVKALFRRGKAW